MKNGLLKAALLPLLLLLPLSLVADEQGWFNNSLSVKLNQELSLKFTQETRNHELTMADAYLHNWSGGLSWAVNSKIYIAAGYLRETTKKSAFNLHENRYMLEGGWKTSLAKNLNFDVRVRSEIRIFEDDLAQDHLRLRLRLRLVHKMTVASLTVKPFLAVEPFANMKEGEISLNRVYAGVTIPLSKPLTMNINYIRQDAKDKDPIHVLNCGFDLSF